MPQQAKNAPQHEPRNGLLLCILHRTFFDQHLFFIRFFPDVSLNNLLCADLVIHVKQVKKFVLINYSDHYFDDIEPYHGKAIALDIADKLAPFPSLFIIHEMRDRGIHPFHDTSPNVSNDNAINWQDWILTSGVLDNTKSHFYRHGPHGSDAFEELPQMIQIVPLMTTSGGGKSSASGTHPLEFNQKVIADILAATHAMPSWRECEIEGTRWTGTAEEISKSTFLVSHKILMHQFKYIACTVCL